MCDVTTMCMEDVYPSSLPAYTLGMSVCTHFQNVHPPCLSTMSIREHLRRIRIEDVYPASLSAYTWAVSFWKHFENVYPECLSRVSTKNVYRECLFSKSFLHTLGEYLSGYTSRMSIRECLPTISTGNVCTENVNPESLCAYTWRISFWIHFENVYRECLPTICTENVYRECLCAYTWRMSFWIHFGGCVSRMISRKTVSNCERLRHPPKSLWRKSFWMLFGPCLSRLDRLWSMSQSFTVTLTVYTVWHVYTLEHVSVFRSLQVYPQRPSRQTFWIEILSRCSV